MHRQRHRVLGAMLAAILLALASPLGAAAATGWTALTLDQGATVGLVYIPVGVDQDQPAPVTLFFHGLGGSIAAYAPYLGPSAETAGLVLILVQSEDADGGWSSADLPALNDALAQVGAMLPLDPARTSLSGHSAGGAMAYLLGYSSTGISALFTCSAPAYPVTAIADPAYTAPIRMCYGDQDPNYTGGSYQALLQQWQALGVTCSSDIRAGYDHDSIITDSDAITQGFTFLASQRDPAAAATSGGGGTTGSGTTAGGQTTSGGTAGTAGSASASGTTAGTATSGGGASNGSSSAGTGAASATSGSGGGHGCGLGGAVAVLGALAWRGRRRLRHPARTAVRTAPRVLALVLAAFLLGAWAPAAESLVPVCAPSANHGRTGTYHVDIVGQSGYGYYVCVPPTYDEHHPAGLHLFFHGQGGQSGAPSFDAWNGPFLSRYNLIGINMQYMDGDNMRDSAGKARAARIAVAQVIADYKILVGRGIICSFSGGGVPHGLINAASQQVRGRAFPFCEVALYSSNFRQDISRTCPLAWAISVGEDEWPLATLGADAVRRMNELYQGVPRGTNPDICFTVLPHKGHSIHPTEIAHAADAFERADLAFAPFVYAADFPEPALRSIVAACDALAVGPASQRLTKLAASATLAPKLRPQVEALQALCQARLARLVSCGEHLAAEDPVLASYYLPRFIAEADGTSEAAILRQQLHACQHRPTYRTTCDAYLAFLRRFPQLLPGQGSSPIPPPAQVPVLRELVPPLGDTQTGMVAAGLLALVRQ